MERTTDKGMETRTGRMAMLTRCKQRLRNTHRKIKKIQMRRWSSLAVLEIFAFFAFLAIFRYLSSSSQCSIPEKRINRNGLVCLLVNWYIKLYFKIQFNDLYTLRFSLDLHKHINIIFHTCKGSSTFDLELPLWLRKWDLNRWQM